MEDIRVETQPLVNVKISSNLSSFLSEQRFDRGMTINDLKGRLELITGGSASSMKVELFDDKDNLIEELADNKSLLGAYLLADGQRIHVTDIGKKLGEFDDLSQVQKFELSENEYSKRSDSVRSFLKRNQLGKYNEEEQKRIDKEKELERLEEEEKANSIKVGDRCDVRGTTAGTQRGEVKFVGKTHFKDGWWIGVQYDEPAGKNDGSINGKRYFDAPQKYGVFIRPALVTVGDFPELTDDIDEM